MNPSVAGVNPAQTDFEIANRFPLSWRRKKRKRETAEVSAVARDHLFPQSNGMSRGPSATKDYDVSEGYITDPVDETLTQYAVKEVSMDEFFVQDLKQLMRDSSEERFRVFFEYFSPISNPESSEVDYSQIWIQVPEGHFSAEQKEFYLNCMVFEGEYTSNTVREGELDSRPSASRSRSYYHLKIFEDEDLQKLLLHLRWDKEGCAGEIIYIQRGEQITGNQMKNICMQLLDFLKIDFIYLNDDATIIFEDYLLKLRIANYLPIVSDDGETWYGKNQFSPLYCKDVQTHEKNIKLSQDPVKYYGAVNVVRTTKIVDLLRSFCLDVRSNEVQKSVMQLCQKYLTLVQGEISEESTVHDLGKAIFNAIRKPMHPIEKKQVNRDFVTFHKIFLIPKHYKENVPSEYNKAIETITSCAIWKRHFRYPQNNTSFHDFIHSDQSCYIK